MQALERRQAARIIRNAREAERRIFELIEELQDASHDDRLAYDWLCAIDKLDSVHNYLKVCRDLVENIDAAMENVEGGAA